MSRCIDSFSVRWPTSITSHHIKQKDSQWLQPNHLTCPAVTDGCAPTSRPNASSTTPEDIADHTQQLNTSSLWTIMTIKLTSQLRIHHVLCILVTLEESIANTNGATIILLSADAGGTFCVDLLSPSYHVSSSSVAVGGVDRWMFNRPRSELHACWRLSTPADQRHVRYNVESL